MKLSAYQMFWMIFTMEIGMTTLLTIGPAISEARQAAWLSVLLAVILCLFITFIAAQLSLLYPKETLIEYAPKIIGTWLGRLVSFSYLLVWYSVSGIILREYSDFVHLALFTSTPMWVITLLTLIALIYIVTGEGVPVIGRCSEIIGPFVLINIVVITLLSIKDMKLHHILSLIPESGVLSIWKGSLSPLSFMGESIMIMMLISYLPDRRKALLSTMGGVAVSGILAVNLTLNVLMILGSKLPAKLQYPVYTYIQYTSVMDFIQNIDVLGVIVSIFSIFIKLALYLLITSNGISQMFKMRNKSIGIWLSALVIYLIAVIPKNSNISQIQFPQLWKSFVFPIFIVGLPFMLWLIGLTRQKLKVEKN